MGSPFSGHGVGGAAPVLGHALVPVDSGSMPQATVRAPGQGHRDGAIRATKRSRWTTGPYDLPRPGAVEQAVPPVRQTVKTPRVVQFNIQGAVDPTGLLSSIVVEEKSIVPSHLGRLRWRPLPVGDTNGRGRKAPYPIKIMVHRVEAEPQSIDLSGERESSELFVREPSWGSTGT